MRILATALLLPVALAACAGQENAPAPESVDAAVVLVRRSSVPSLHTVAGTVRAETTSTLAANMVGTVMRVHVAEGDRVRAGQLLVEIDAKDRHAQVERMGARRTEVERAIEAASANAQLAEATHRRMLALRNDGLASPQSYDEARAAQLAAQAELQRALALRGEARAAATEADAMLAHSNVRAPIDGVIAARFVDPGAQAAPGVALLAIENETATRVDTHVAEDVAVRPGDRAVVTAANERIEARVIHVQPSVDSAARSSLVKLRLTRPVRAGTYVRVSFTTGQRDVIAVPETALVRRGSLTSVFVVGADDIARMRLITIGSSAETQAEVLSGLAAGETIVSQPARVRDGVVVRRSA